MRIIITWVIAAAFALAAAAQSTATDEYLCRLQLERYGALYTAALADTATGTDIRDLLTAFNADITDALRQNDFIVAAVLLDEALALLEEPPVPPETADDNADTSPKAVPDVAPAADAGPWSFEAAAGTEYSLYDSVGNAETVPYLRIGAERSAPWAGFSTVLTADAVARGDSTATANLALLADRTFGRLHVNAENDLSRVHESDPQLQDYTENDLTCALAYTLSDRTGLDMDSYASVRRYGAPDSSNYDYTRFGATAGATFIPTPAWYMGCDAGIDRRTAALDADNDYTAFGSGLRCERYFRLTDRISADYRAQYTAYDHPRDTSYLANDYLEQYLYAEAVVGFLSRFQAKFSVDAETYDYLLNTEFTPDQRALEIKPGVGCDVTPNLNTGLSVAFNTARHTAGGDDSLWASYARGEDYDGVTGELTLDWFRTDLFFLSVAYSYQYKRYSYPDDAYFGGDTRTHSLVVFGSLSIGEHLELEVSTFHDDETQEQLAGEPDTRSTLVNYTGELVYRF